MNSKDNLNFDDLEEINMLLKEYKPFYNMYRKLLVIKNVKEGMNRGEAAEVVNVHRKTAENWVKSYNKNGLSGLESNYSNCGLNCRLSNQQLSELKNLVLENPGKYTVENIRILIMKRYNIKYSNKQTWYILRRKLSLNYDGNKLIP
jgi:transposase